MKAWFGRGQVSRIIAEVGVLFERYANRGGGGLRSGVELPSFNSVHGGIDEQGMSADRFDGCDFARR